MTTVSDILDTLRTYSPDADVQPVMRAYLLAAKAHAGQTRKTGEPYLTHPLAVALILAKMRMDVETIATALLHDTLEDNPLGVTDLEREMGPTVVSLVEGVTKIGKLRFRSSEELQAENFRKMMIAMSKDLRVILVKLADRLHNMQTLDGHGKPEKMRAVAQETWDIFVPVANRLGLTMIKGELEDLCFAVLEPEANTEILSFLDSTQADRDRYTQRVVAALGEELRAQGVRCDVSGRAKHPASIFRKMKEQGLKVHEVPDLLAFRIVVDDVGSCYHALGLVHAHFPPVPDRIKDYIARPKANGYQSLHTTVIGPEGRRVEAQIRTRDMHRVAEDGIAAHWRYKEGHLALSPDDVAKISRIRDVFETARDADSAAEFMATVKGAFYADEVFVFTPAGDVKQLQLGATGLDFAYAVHTNVGNHTVGVKVNGKMVPLRHVLKSGDTVEVLTRSDAKPTKDWEEIAKTGRAISKIRRFLRDEEREFGIKLGREMVEAELKRVQYTVAKLEIEPKLLEAISARSLKTLDDLYLQIALGHIVMSQVLREVLPEDVMARRDAPASTLGTLLNRFRPRTESPVLIQGEDGVLVAFAKCCSPLPGEPVAGFVTRGRGISVHKFECPTYKGLDTERKLSVEWDPASLSKHAGEIQVVCADRPGMLSNITKIVEQAKININKAEARTMPDGHAMCRFELALRDVSELNRLIKNIEKVAGVESVARIVG